MSLSTEFFFFFVALHKNFTVQGLEMRCGQSHSVLQQLLLVFPKVMLGSAKVIKIHDA